MFRTLILALLFLLHAVPAGAAVTIDEVVAQAVERNPTLAAALAEVRAARRQWSAEAALPNLNILFVPGINGLGGTGEELLVSQPLGFNGVPAARARVARFQTESQRASALIAMLDLVLEVRSACLALYRARARLAVHRELLASAQRFSDMARVQFEIGSRSEVDAAQAHLELLRARQATVTAEADERNAVATLNSLLAQGGAPPPDLAPLDDLSPPAPAPVPPPPAPAPVPPPHATAPVPPPHAPAPASALPSPRPVPATPQGAQAVAPDAQMQAALSRRPEIQQAEADRRAADARARAIRAEGNPEIAPQFRAYSVLQGLREYGVGIAVNLPIVDYGSRRNQARAAEAQAAASEARRVAAEQAVQREVVVARSQLQAAEASLQVATEAVAQSRRLMDAQVTGFGAGVTSVLSLLEAQRSWRYAELERIDARVGLRLAGARLDRATAALPDALLELARRKEAP